MTREPLNLEALRRREVQMMGAAISTRSWHDMENAYNQLRDKIDAELTRLHLATKDAADPQSRGQAFDGEGEERARCMNIVHNHYDIGRDALVALLKGEKA